MKILHTADWHIGCTLYCHDRTDEHRAVFDRLVDIVAGEKPDVLLVSGDIFHNPRPGAGAHSMLTSVLLRLLRAAPGMRIVITAGNHDSASMHEIFRDAWRELGVYAVGSAVSDDEVNFSKLIIEIPGKCFIVAVPYVYSRLISDGLFQRLLDETAWRNAAGLPVFLMAHAMVSLGGADVDARGADETVESSVFGVGYDYAALGHVHVPMTISGGSGRKRYSGSILPVSFDEDFEHSVTRVQIDSHGERAVVDTIPLPAPVPVVTLPLNGQYEPWSVVLERLKKFDSPHSSYIRLNVSRDEAVPADADIIAARICDSAGHRFCTINYPPVDYSAAGGVRRAMTIEEFKMISPDRLADMYAEEFNLDYDDELRALFREVAESVYKRKDED